MQGDQLFFQLAATLIPVFLFVGAVTQRLHPGPWTSRPSGTIFAAVVILVITAVPVTAEAIAINASLGNRASSFDRWFVAGTLCLATATACLSVIWPLLADLDDRLGSKFRVVVVIATLLLAASSARLLHSGVTAAEEEARYAELEHAVAQFSGPLGNRLKRTYAENAVAAFLATSGIHNRKLAHDLVSPASARITAAAEEIPGTLGAFVKRIQAEQQIKATLIDFGMPKTKATHVVRKIMRSRPGAQLRELLEALEFLGNLTSGGMSKKDASELFKRFKP